MEASIGRETIEFVEEKKSRRLALLVLVSLTSLFLVSVLYTASQADADGRYFTLCGFKILTGLPCPGCGLTHSFCAIGKGDLGEAFYFNAIGPPLYLIAIVVWLRFLFVLVGVKGPVAAFDRAVNHIKLVRAFAIALGLFGLGRIVYLVIWQPAGLRDSPLMRLVERIIN